MKDNKLPIIFILGISIIISSATAFFIDSNHFLLHFVNTLFYIALCFILVGGFLFVFERGFFNLTRYGFRKAFKVNNKKLASLVEAEDSSSDEQDLLYATYSFRLTYPLVVASIILGIISTFITLTVLV